MMADEDQTTVDNIDAEIVLADGSRWSVTFLTLDAIARVLDRWKASGEYKSGAYLRIPDLVITSRPGIASMMVAAEDLIEHGLDGVLPRLEEAGDE